MKRLLTEFDQSKPKGLRRHNLTLRGVANNMQRRAGHTFAFLIRNLATGNYCRSCDDLFTGTFAFILDIPGQYLSASYPSSIYTLTVSCPGHLVHGCVWKRAIFIDSLSYSNASTASQYANCKHTRQNVFNRKNFGLIGGFSTVNTV